MLADIPDGHGLDGLGFLGGFYHGVFALAVHSEGDTAFQGGGKQCGVVFFADFEGFPVGGYDGYAALGRLNGFERNDAVYFGKDCGACYGFSAQGLNYH